jgi:23S rRNA pseudouridine2605 synthase
MSEKLQKIMSRAGLGSRRQNEAVILAGRVRVNGQIAHLGDRADQNKDRIEVDGHLLQFTDKIYIKLYKPKGIISSTEDELGKGRPTVRDMVDLPGHLYPVGRLDKQSEGLMLLTNDGKLTYRLTHPRFGHQKVYRVAIEGKPPYAIIQHWRDGVELDGKLTAPAEIEVLHQQKDHTWLRITMREGRKRQIRRIAALLGHPVNKLIREEIGPIQLGSLQPGQWEHLSEKEIKQLNETIRRSKKIHTNYRRQHNYDNKSVDG